MTRFPLGFAHRGARAHAPENTLEAFRLALAMGATALESDVWLTRDGVAVLDHDGEFGGRTIDRLASHELPAHVPTLSQLLESCGAGVPLSLDVKDAAAIEATLETARAHDALGMLWLCHWNWKTVASWRRLSDEIQLVDSASAYHMKTAPEPRAERMAEHGIDAINLHHEDWQPEWVGIFQHHGRRAFAWGVQDDAALERVLDWGIDGIYSDHVDRMSDALRAFSAATPTRR